MVPASIFFSTSDIIYFIKEKEEIYTKRRNTRILSFIRILRLVSVFLILNSSVPIPPGRANELAIERKISLMKKERKNEQNRSTTGCNYTWRAHNGKKNTSIINWGEQTVRYPDIWLVTRSRRH